MIAAIVVPDFIIALERQQHGIEAIVPLIIYTFKGNGRQVMACCPTAKRLGVTVGMSRTGAHGRCPEAREENAHPALYQRAADSLCAAFLQWSDRIEYEIAANLSLWLDFGQR